MSTTHSYTHPNKLSGNHCLAVVKKAHLLKPLLMWFFYKNYFPPLFSCQNYFTAGFSSFKNEYEKSFLRLCIRYKSSWYLWSNGKKKLSQIEFFYFFPRCYHIILKRSAHQFYNSRVFSDKLPYFFNVRAIKCNFTHFFCL